MLIACSVGRFTVPLALIVLILFVIQVEPTNEALVAWLPFYSATVGIITTSVAHILEQALQATDPSFRNDENDTSTTREQQESPQTPAITRWMSEPLQPLARYVLSDSSHRVQSSERSVSTMSLSGTGQVQPSWGPQVHGFWNKVLAQSQNRNRSDGPDSEVLAGRYNRELEPYYGGSPSVETEVGSSTCLISHEDS